MEQLWNNLTYRNPSIEIFETQYGFALNIFYSINSIDKFKFRPDPKYFSIKGCNFTFWYFVASWFRIKTMTSLMTWIRRICYFYLLVSSMLNTGRCQHLITNVHFYNLKINWSDKKEINWLSLQEGNQAFVYTYYLVIIVHVSLFLYDSRLHQLQFIIFIIHYYNISLQ